jgi:SAM-dependent MidA family methyltransferase
MREVAASLQKGFVLTIDYGNDSTRLYQDSRREGTLVCYHKHRVNFNYYQNIGSQDITAHVNFSALKHWGIKQGLEFCGYTTQAYFLMGLGLSMHARTQAVNEDASRFLQTFLLDMGTKLKVLIQQKGLDKPRLSGLNFGQQLY